MSDINESKRYWGIDKKADVIYYLQYMLHHLPNNRNEKGCLAENLLLQFERGYSLYRVYT